VRTRRVELTRSARHLTMCVTRDSRRDLNANREPKDEHLTKYSRDFGTPSKQIHELCSLLKLATALDINLHVNWDKRYPHQWNWLFIENAGSEAASGGRVLKLSY
jgi:hypothetical protein